MIDEREIVRVAVERLAPPEPAYERLVERRDRKRRNQRIAAGVVGIAVFVAAVWIVTSVGRSIALQTPVVPGGAGTGQTETGPAVTGPAEAVDRGENPEPPPLVEPVPIGTVTQSGAGCALEMVADPVPSGAGQAQPCQRDETVGVVRTAPLRSRGADVRAVRGDGREWGVQGFRAVRNRAARSLRAGSNGRSGRAHRG